MLHLSKHIELSKENIQATNLTHLFDKADLDAIGIECSDGMKRDEQSRSTWMKRMQAGMKLAMQVQEAKNFPWPECSNVKFPLITIASMQFHARAYPTLINGSEVVHCRTIGEDPQGKKKARSLRVATHMSYQVLEEDQAWEEQHDKMMINVPIVGTAFKKTLWGDSNGYVTGDLVLAQDLVMDYYAKSVDKCMRKTHKIPLYRNEIYEKVQRGIYRDVLEEDWYTGAPPPHSDDAREAVNKRQGLTAPQAGDSTTPLVMCEQHTWMDLDGDGYAEPVYVTFEETSNQVVRIALRFEREEDIEKKNDGTIIRIRAIEHFTKYPFIPSPDGGIYDVGFGYLLGPLNESVNTGINQLFDAGTMSTAAGGFLGRGAKIRGGVYTFAPLQWKRVDSTGDDLRKNIFPLPVREPSQVLYNLLVLLINYTNRISGSNDAVVGENPGQNTPAQTEQTMIEQGLKIYSAIFKRLWRAEKDEFKKRFLFNGLYMKPGRGSFGDGQEILQEDYLSDPNHIVPAADPNLVSDTQRLQQALAVKQSAATTPGYNRDEVERNFLRSLKVEGWQTLFVGADKTGPLPNPKVQVEQIKARIAQQKDKNKLAMFAMDMKETHALNQAKIMQLRAQALKLIEEAGGVKEGNEIKRIEAMIDALEASNKHIQDSVSLVKELMDAEQAAERGGMGGMGEQPGNAGSVPNPAPALA